MRLLNGRELSGYVKVRQAKAVRSLKQANGITPGLAIIMTTDNPSIETYVRLKQAYADEMGVSFQLHRPKQADVPALMKQLQADTSIHGVVLQLPLADPAQTDDFCQLIPPAKDIDGLNPQADYDGATATAVNWLLTGYGIDLAGKKLVIIGQGKLVGQPLLKLWQNSKFDVVAMDKDNLSKQTIKQAQVVVTATGRPSLLKADDLAAKAVVVDAGSACVDGQLAGDIDPEVYQKRDDLIITPKFGGLGPVTINVLFENLLTAAQKTIPPS